jgi:Uma2 family endonuclease
MAVSYETYERLALEDPEGQWELFCGRPRRKTGMTQEHNSVAWWLATMLQAQVDRKLFQVRADTSRARRGDNTAFIPDVVVFPTSLMRSLGPAGPLEAYADPLPFVAEVWSRSTGEYDVDEKFPEYKRRGDLEIWRVHPYDRQVIAWRRQPDGSYRETFHASGVIPIESLPGVSIDMADLFADLG